MTIRAALRRWLGLGSLQNDYNTRKTANVRVLCISDYRIRKGKEPWLRAITTLLFESSDCDVVFAHVLDERQRIVIKDFGSHIELVLRQIAVQ